MHKKSPRELGLKEVEVGANDRNRTYNLSLTGRLLCRLSYISGVSKIVPLSFGFKPFRKCGVAKEYDRMNVCGFILYKIVVGVVFGYHWASLFVEAGKGFLTFPPSGWSNIIMHPRFIKPNPTIHNLSLRDKRKNSIIDLFSRFS